MYFSSAISQNYLFPTVLKKLIVRTKSSSVFPVIKNKNHSLSNQELDIGCFSKLMYLELEVDSVRFAPRVGFVLFSRRSPVNVLQTTHLTPD